LNQLKICELCRLYLATRVENQLASAASKHDQGDSRYLRPVQQIIFRAQSEMDRTDALRRKLVIIGDGACGKTSLLSVFTLGYFPTVMAA